MFRGCSNNDLFFGISASRIVHLIGIGVFSDPVRSMFVCAWYVGYRVLGLASDRNRFLLRHPTLVGTNFSVNMNPSSTCKSNSVAAEFSTPLTRRRVGYGPLDAWGPPLSQWWQHSSKVQPHTQHLCNPVWVFTTVDIFVKSRGCFAKYLCNPVCVLLNIFATR